MMVLSGSLTPQAPQDFYAWCVNRATDAAINVIVDASGEPLRRALATKPFIVKPNRAELARTLDTPLESDNALRDAIRRLRETDHGRSRLSLAEFKALVREQYFMLLIDSEGAIAAISTLLPPDADLRRKACQAIKTVLSAPGEVTGEAAARLRRITQLFAAEVGRGLRKGIARPIMSSIDAAKAS